MYQPILQVVRSLTAKYQENVRPNDDESERSSLTPLKAVKTSKSGTRFVVTPDEGPAPTKAKDEQHVDSTGTKATSHTGQGTIDSTGYTATRVSVPIGAGLTAGPSSMKKTKSEIRFVVTPNKGSAPTKAGDKQHVDSAGTKATSHTGQGTIDNMGFSAQHASVPIGTGLTAGPPQSDKVKKSDQLKDTTPTTEDEWHQILKVYNPLEDEVPQANRASAGPVASASARHDSFGVGRGRQGVPVKDFGGRINDVKKKLATRTSKRKDMKYSEEHHAELTPAVMGTEPLHAEP